MTAAAKLLDLQQPTISAHIQRLENEYGVELFLRQGRRLELTTLAGLCWTTRGGHSAARKMRTPFWQQPKTDSSGVL